MPPAARWVKNPPYIPGLPQWSDFIRQIEEVFAEEIAKPNIE